MTSTISCSFLENNTQFQDQNWTGLYSLACVAGVWKGREREFPSRLVSRPNSLPLPFRTPATQAIYSFSAWIRIGAKTTPFGAAHTYMVYITEYPLLQGLGKAPQQPEMPSSSLTFIDKFFDRVYFVLLEISCKRAIHFKSVMLKTDKEVWNVIHRILKPSLDLIRLDTNVLKDSLWE